MPAQGSLFFDGDSCTGVIPKGYGYHTAPRPEPCRERANKPV